MSKMMSLSANSTSDMSSDKSAMGNGHGASHASSPKYKRRLVFAVRTFPLGYGPLPLQAVSMPKEDVVHVDSKENEIMTEKSRARNYPPRTFVLAVRHFPLFCRQNDPSLVKKTDETGMQSLENYVVGNAAALKRKVGDNDTEVRDNEEYREKAVKKMKKGDDFVTTMEVDKNARGKCVDTGKWVENQVQENKHEPQYSTLKKITSTKEKCDQIVLWDGEKSKKSRTLCVNPPPRVGSSSVNIGARDKVKAALRHFKCICRQLSQEDEASKFRRQRIDLDAVKVLRKRNQFVNTDKNIGHVPGVEVGDEFSYRVELAVVGVHGPYQGGIDYVKQGGKNLAISIVASGGYDDDLQNSDVLIYSGQGGTGDRQRVPEDQKLERGNLSLANSKDEKNPVRVIRGETTNPSDPKSRIYIYDGLYVVDSYWQASGKHGKKVYQFKLVRIPGQPKLASKAVNKKQTT
ncbi:hypothetical protein ACFE04_026993 [Oxalis oulophora]